MEREIWWLVITLAFALPQVGGAQAPSNQEFERIREIADARRAAWRAPGIVFSVLRGDSPPVSGAVGVSNVETGTAMEPGMLVSVASVSKLVTATTALTLVAEGLLDLNTPIRRYLADLPPGLGGVTLEQLLSHTAGLGEGTPVVSLTPRRELRPVCNEMTDSTLLADPDETWGYTNTAYTLVGCVLEAVVGEPFERVVRRRVFEPVGMKRSTFSPRVAMTYPHAQGHDTRETPPQVVRPFNSAPHLMPAGELITTVEDLGLLAQALMNDGLVNGHQVLPEGILESMARPRGHGAPLAGGSRDYGLGITSRMHRGELLLEHEGVYGGFGASFVLIPERRVAAIAVTNARYSTPALATQAAVDVLLGHEPEIPSPKYVLISPVDSARATGRYESLFGTVEVRSVNGRLSFVPSEGAAYAIAAREEGHWEIQDYPPYRPLPATPLEIVSTSSGAIDFIRLAWRIYRRVPE